MLKNFACGAKNEVLYYRVIQYTYKSSFFSLLAPQAIFCICTSFRSDFAVKNDDFQRERWNPIWFFSELNLRLLPKRGGGSFHRNPTTTSLYSPFLHFILTTFILFCVDHHQVEVHAETIWCLSCSVWMSRGKFTQLHVIVEKYRREAAVFLGTRIIDLFFLKQSLRKIS